MNMLSVIIITWNAQQDVKACLDSVVDSTRNRNVEIIVIDNGSTDHTCEILQLYYNKIKLILLGENKGVAVARNVGLKAAKGDLLWILDIDTVVNKIAVDEMVGYMENNPDCGLCTCRLQSAEGTTQDSCRRLPHLKYKIRNVILSDKFKSFLPNFLYKRLVRKNEEQFYHFEMQSDKPFNIEYAIGACQIFRKSVLDRVGYLDENIFYGPEDADFCLRISQAGFKIVCLPYCSIIHHYNRMTQKRFFSRMTFIHLKGLFYFYKKYRFFVFNKSRQNG